MRILFGILGGLVAVALIAVVAGMWWLTTGSGRDWAVGQVSERVGRDIIVEDMSVDWGWRPEVDVTGLKLANAVWARADHLLTADRVAFKIHPWPLLRGDIELDYLILQGLKVDLERNAEGDANWSFGENPASAAAVEGVSPEDRDDAPRIGRLEIREGTLAYRDPERGIDVEGTVSTGSGEMDAPEPLSLGLKGTLQDQPLSIDFVGGSILELRDGDDPYPVDLTIAAGKTDFTLKGTFADPIALEGADVEIDFSGPNLADIFPLFGVPTPPTPPYKLTGRVTREGKVWTVEGLDGRIGDSDIAGSATLDYGPERPMLTADLVSQKLDFDDLGPLVGATPAYGEGETASEEQERIGRQLVDQGKLFPDIPIAAGRLRLMDMKVTFKAPNVLSRTELAVTSLEATVTLENGRAVAKPFKMGVADGVVSGELALNARDEVPSADADVTFDDLALAAFFKDSKYFETMGGTLSGSLYILGRGNSLADIMAAANGDGVIEISKGAFSGLLIEAAGVDLVESLILFIGDDARVPIRCGAGRAVVKDGVAQFDRVVVDTADSVLYARGGVNLLDQTVDLFITADAKDFSLIDMEAPVRVRGPLGDPETSISPDKPDIPFFEMGEAEDVDCGALRQQVMKGD
ncbi:AsmA family protein [Thalassobaculum sp. OXR-137]|uniref:AsmA family protein n=1 Tax=Thalassobaculum sp. OXR-137 TaxID=3100173 RepID=UPI002AC99FC9|nr:AsmA family protein [Thalassobaculum sp. OXR-137]WPZ36677.1 AsmA family protein [Thalassobaculum sp. OXR-137]